MPSFPMIGTITSPAADPIHHQPNIGIQQQATPGEWQKGSYRSPALFEIGVHGSLPIGRAIAVSLGLATA